MKGRIPLGADEVGDGAGNPLAGAFTLFDRVADIVVPLIDETPLEDRVDEALRLALATGAELHAVSDPARPLRAVYRY